MDWSIKYFDFLIIKSSSPDVFIEHYILRLCDWNTDEESSTNMLVLCYDSVEIEMRNARMIDNRVVNSKKLPILLVIWIKTSDLIWIPLYGLNFFLQKLWIQKPWQFNWYKMTSVKAYNRWKRQPYFFLANLFLKQGISSEYVMVDFICMG